MLKIFSLEMPVVKGKFIRRYKRFLADVILDNGQSVTAHCPNSGSMKSCLESNAEAFLTDHGPSTHRKLRYTLEMLHLQDGLACINTHRANQVAEGLLRWGLKHKSSLSNSCVQDAFQGVDIFFKDLGVYDTLAREVVFKQGTRFDFCMTSASDYDSPLWVEVKSVSLRLDCGKLAFPDAVTERGQKHLRDLVEAHVSGQCSILWYIVMRSSSHPISKLEQSFSIAKSIDSKYADQMSSLLSAGVKVRVLFCDVTPSVIALRSYSSIEPSIGDILYA